MDKGLPDVRFRDLAVISLSGWSDIWRIIGSMRSVCGTFVSSSACTET